MKKLASLFIVLLVVTGCRINIVNNINATGIVSFEILQQSAYGGREQRSDMVITNQNDLQSLYSELNLGDAPHVDFDTNNVVALFLGQKSSGGYSIGVRSVMVEGNVATVKVSIRKPEPGENATMAITTPYSITVIPKTERVIIEE